MIQVADGSDVCFVEKAPWMILIPVIPSPQPPCPIRAYFS